MPRAITFALLLALRGAECSPLLSNLQIEGLVTPLALSTTATPHFSWLTGGAQHSYQIILTQIYPTQATLWDTGVVVSNASTFIPYAGTTSPLPPDSDFHWTLNVLQDGIGFTSADSTFSTAPSTPLPGSWLGFADTVRGTLALSPLPVQRARLHATGVGCYVVYVNGARVSPDLTPGFGHAPSARALFNTYDVSRHLVPGENVVGMRIGSCKWGAFGQYCTGSAAQCNAGWVYLSVTQGEGNTTTLSTSGGGGEGAWLAANTSILYQHLWNGELFDARLEPSGWNAPGFNGTPSWSPATAVSYPDLIGPLTPAPGPPLVPRDLDPLTPATVTIPVGGDAGKGGPFVFDLGPGMNLAGLCGMDLAPPPGESPVGAGVAVSLLHGEILHLNGNGSVWNHFLPPGGTHQPNGLNQPQMNYTYVTRGGGEDNLAQVGPHFSFFGFRYVEMRGWPYITPPTPSRLTCHFLHTVLPASGALDFPMAPSLNDLQTSTIRTHLSNYVTVPTDCPQREKRGWTGDAQLTAHSGMLNFESLAFYKAWHASILDQQVIGCLPAGEAPGRAGGVAGAPIRPLNWACDPPSSLKNITLAQFQFGPVSDVVPREQVGMGYFIGDPSWEVAATTIPYELLTSGGDLDHTAATYTQGPFSMVRWLNALGEDDAASGGLITWSYLGDWVAIDTPSRYLVANINYFMAVSQTAEMAGALGKSGDAVTLLALATLLSQSIRGKFWNASAGHWDAGSQSAQALALGFGVGGGDLVGPASTALLQALNATGGHLTVGASGAQVLLKVLHTINPASALALALQPSYPSWGAFLTPNSTFSPVPLPGTMWEAWDLASAQGGSSFNHIFKAGGISPFLYEGALGVAFAMRPQQQQEGEDYSAAPSGPCPCETDKGSLVGEGGFLPWATSSSATTATSLSARFGLSCSHIQILCDVVKDGARETALGPLAAKVARAFSLAGLPFTTEERESSRRRALVPKLGLTVTAAAALSLGKASGWRVTPAGNVSFEWEMSGGGSASTGRTLRVHFKVPSGVDGKLELPLGVFGGGGTSVVTLSVLAVAVGGVEGRIFGGVVNGTGPVISGVDADDAMAWAPSVKSCGGEAAAHVEGKANGQLAGCSPVLLMTLPKGGEYAVVMQG